MIGGWTLIQIGIAMTAVGLILMTFSGWERWRDR